MKNINNYKQKNFLYSPDVYEAQIFNSQLSYILK